MQQTVSIGRILGNKAAGYRALGGGTGASNQNTLFTLATQEGNSGSETDVNPFKLAKKEWGERQNTPPHPESACLGLLVCGFGILSFTATSLEEDKYQPLPSPSSKQNQSPRLRKPLPDRPASQPLKNSVDHLGKQN